jgi:hypothetical protein
MKTMFKKFYAKPLAVYLATALLAISTFAGPAEAMFVTSAPHQDAAVPTSASTDREAGLAKIQAALESKLVQQKLMDYGLNHEETMARVNKLSDEQLNQLTSHTDSLQAGGAQGISLVALLLIIILVILIAQAPGQADTAGA